MELEKCRYGRIMVQRVAAQHYKRKHKMVEIPDQPFSPNYVDEPAPDSFKFKYRSLLAAGDKEYFIDSVCHKGIIYYTVKHCSPFPELPKVFKWEVEQV